MKESRRKELATHPDPESCTDDRKVGREALTGESAGQVSSCEIKLPRVPTLLSEAEGITGGTVTGKVPPDSAQSQTLSMHGHLLHENREILDMFADNPSVIRALKAIGRTNAMHVSRKSDSDVVPMKPSNKPALMAGAEMVEGRLLAKGNADQTTTVRTQSRVAVSNGLEGVREVARRDKKMRFTALLHHVDLEMFRTSYASLKKRASPGVDGMTWEAYGDKLEERLVELLRKVHVGEYRALPSRRVYIPKADGRQRPLGIAALEDKIVQSAIGTVLNAVYEEDFSGFSYGFRPGRGQHDCLDALATALMRKRVSWVLDADIRGFFDSIDHGWMMKFIAHRIADSRILRLIAKWLKAGVLEDGMRTETVQGTPQGAVISPLLANIYLHYVLDLWTKHWRKANGVGETIIVRYADDFVLGFERHADAERYRNDLEVRLRKFGLSLHPDKTRLIEFGRFAARERSKRGEGKPETFNFLGFTHYCGTSRAGKFMIWRKTIAKRMASKLKEIAEELMKRLHESIPQLGAWLKAVVQGYFNYHAVPGNGRSIMAFRTQLSRAWFRSLRRRSQKACLKWDRMNNLANRWLPRVRILHPYPWNRFEANT